MDELTSGRSVFHTLPQAFRAICRPNRNQACLVCGSTPALSAPPSSGVPSTIRRHPASPHFGPSRSPERTLALFSSPPSRPVSHTLIFFSCSYVRKNWRQSEGPPARGVGSIQGSIRCSGSFLYFTSKTPPIYSTVAPASTFNPSVTPQPLQKSFHKIHSPAFASASCPLQRALLRPLEPEAGLSQSYIKELAGIKPSMPPESHTSLKA